MGGLIERIRAIAGVDAGQLLPLDGILRKIEARKVVCVCGCRRVFFRKRRRSFKRAFYEDTHRAAFHRALAKKGKKR